MNSYQFSIGKITPNKSHSIHLGFAKGDVREIAVKEMTLINISSVPVSFGKVALLDGSWSHTHLS